MLLKVLLDQEILGAILRRRGGLGEKDDWIESDGQRVRKKGKQTRHKERRKTHELMDEYGKEPHSFHKLFSAYMAAL